MFSPSTPCSSLHSSALLGAYSDNHKHARLACGLRTMEEYGAQLSIAISAEVGGLHLEETLFATQSIHCDGSLIIKRTKMRDQTTPSCPIPGAKVPLAA